MMFTTPDYVALVQREREERIRESRLARIADCIRAACDPSLVDRLARALRRAPAAC
ncbi:MAG TPA: hypothetical protein VF802_07235 [Candidatus Limnocylindrales bacterium]